MWTPTLQTVRLKVFPRYKQTNSSSPACCCLLLPAAACHCLLHAACWQLVAGWLRKASRRPRRNTFICLPCCCCWLLAAPAAAPSLLLLLLSCSWPVLTKNWWDLDICWTGRANGVPQKKTLSLFGVTLTASRRGNNVPGSGAKTWRLTKGCFREMKFEEAAPPGPGKTPKYFRKKWWSLDQNIAVSVWKSGSLKASSKRLLPNLHGASTVLDML